MSNTKRQILHWIESIQLDSVPETESQRDQVWQQDHALDSKTCTNPHTLPDNLPLIDEAASMPRSGRSRGTGSDRIRGRGRDRNTSETSRGSPRRKRREDEEDSECKSVGQSFLDQTSKPSRLGRRFPFIQPPESPSKRRSTNLIKTRFSLSLLETTIEIDNFQGQVSAELPEDIQILHRQVYLAGCFLQNIIPYEVRDEVMAAVGDIYPPSCFRQPDQAHQTPGAVAKTKTTHAALRKIMKAAARSTSHGRHEGAWNMCVHWPILDLVFEEEEHVQGITTRAEAIAISVSSAGTTNTTGIADKTEKSVRIHSRGDNKKVDFVLVIDLPSTLPLKQSIRTLITAVNGLRTNPPPPHVNQTTYAPILESPIAVSIQTKTAASAEDALLQLGIWYAAWHKCLHYLRGHLCEMSPRQVQNQEQGQQGQKQESEDHLPTVLLIEVVGHDWQVYFARDLGASITIYGPTPLGSTRDISSAYALLTSLQAIREWVKITFYPGMRRWFNSP